MPRPRTDVDPVWWERLDSEDLAVSAHAMDVIVRHYLGLVDGLVRGKWRYDSQVLDRDELTSYAYIGLMQAIQRYDPAMGSFRKFASSRIQGAITDEMRSADTAPRGFRKDERAIINASNLLRTSTGKEPTISELADKVGFEAARVESTLRRARSFAPHSIDIAAVRPSEDADVDSTAVATAMTERWIRIYDQLQPEVQFLMACLYFRRYTLAQVAEWMGAPLTYVRDLHREVLFRVYVEVRSEVA